MQHKLNIWEMALVHHILLFIGNNLLFNILQFRSTTQSSEYQIHCAIVCTDRKQVPEMQLMQMLSWTVANNL